MTVAGAFGRASALVIGMTLALACGDDVSSADTGPEDTGPRPDSAIADTGPSDSMLPRPRPDAAPDVGPPDLAGWQVVLREGDCTLERARFLEALGDPLWEPCDGVPDCETIVDEPAYVRRYTHTTASDALGELRITYHQSIAPSTDFRTVLIAERGGRIVEALRGCDEVRPHFGNDGGLVLVVDGDWIVYRESIDDALPWRSFGRQELLGSPVASATGVAWHTGRGVFDSRTATTGSELVTGDVDVAWAGTQLFVMTEDRLGRVDISGIAWLVSSDDGVRRDQLGADGDYVFYRQYSGLGASTYSWYRALDSGVVPFAPELLGETDVWIVGALLRDRLLVDGSVRYLDFETGERTTENLARAGGPRFLEAGQLIVSDAPNLWILDLPRP